MSSDDSDDDDDVPLNPSVVKPKAPDGVGSFQLRGGVPPGVEKLGEAAEESAAIAGEDVTVVLQFPDREISVQMKMGHTVELLKLKAREALDNMDLRLEMRLAESDQVMIDPLSLNDYPVAGQKVLRVKVTEL